MLAAIAGLFLTGCSLSKATQDIAPDTSLVTQSIPASIKPEGIEESDAQFITSALTNPASADTAENLNAWSNPETGNQGTITAINDFTSDKGQPCKKFNTTVNSFSGISVYKGEACESGSGSWILSSFDRDSAE